MSARTVPLALLLAGVWLGLLLASWIAATVNFRTVDQVLGPAGSREAQARLDPLKPDDRRMVLRHLASEINRWMFRWWSRAQLALGVLLVLLLWGEGGALRLLSVATLVIVLVQAGGFASSITDLGRAIDFVPRPLPSDLGRRFGLLHGGFVVLDLLKGLGLAAAAFRLVRRA